MRRLKTVRRPPIYPKTPGHLPCSSLTHPLPLSSRRPSVSFGGFGLNLETSAELARQQQEGLKERLDGLVNLSKETLLEVRHYIFDLKPYLAGEKGVASMVENQVREFNTVAGVPTTVETRGEAHQVPVPVATTLYRVTQEALANAFKHARASEVKVLLEFASDGVQLTVQDNGRGFEATSSTSGHGLQNMRQRADELGGTFRLHSSPGEGTQVVLGLPC